MPSWDTSSSSSYDPARRYTAHTDRRGHSVEIRLKLPTTVAAQIGELVASKLIPEYRRSTDVLADAIVHHLYRISREIENENLARTVNMMVLLDDAQRRKMERETFQTLLRTIDDNCRVFYPEGGRHADWEGLREYCMELLDRVDILPSDLRGLYLEKVEGHLKTAGGPL